MARAMGHAHTYPTRRRGGRAVRRKKRALGAMTAFFADIYAATSRRLYFFAGRIFARRPLIFVRQRVGAAGRSITRLACSRASNKRAEHVVISGTGQRSSTASTN